MNAGAVNRSFRWRGLLAWLAVTFVAAMLGALASMDAAERYMALSLPSWAPPPWVFGPVWTLLYAMMGVAAWRVWLEHGWRGARGALSLYLFQLVVNTLWTWLFFAWELRGWATVEVFLLLGMVAVLQVQFARLSTLAGTLLLPYLAWVSFASALSFAVWRLNQ
jgi:tryptophan-rich sensory protein